MKRKLICDSEFDTKKIKMSEHIENMDVLSLEESVGVENERMAGRPSRQAALKASANISESSNDEDDVIDIMDGNSDDARPKTVPIIQKKAINSNLNLFKQFERKLECCD